MRLQVRHREYDPDRRGWWDGDLFTPEKLVTDDPGKYPVPPADRDRWLTIAMVVFFCVLSLILELI